MSKIIGVTVGTTMSPQTIKEKLKPVLSVNGEKPDVNGDVSLEVTKENVEAALGYTPADAEEVERIDQGLNNAFESVWQSFEDAFNALSTLDKQVKANIDMVNNFDSDLADLTNGQKEINDRLDEIENNPEGTEVTKESIEEALGYTPVSDDIYNEITRIDEAIGEMQESSSNYVIEGAFETDDDGNVTAVHLGFFWDDILNAYSANRCLICLMAGPYDKYIQFTPSEFYLGDGYIVFTAVGENGNSYELGLCANGTSYMLKLPTAGAGGGTVHWNDIEDRPFGEMPAGGDTLYWDGNTEGRLEVTAADRYGTTRTYYKVSDAVPTWNDLLQGNGSEEVCLIKNGSSTLYGGAQKEEMMAMIDDCLRVLGVAELYLVGEGGKIASLIEEIVCVMEDNYTHGNFNFPEKGTYFSTNVDSLWLRGCTSFPSTKLMDKKYLPMDELTAAVIAALPVYNGEVEEV